MNFSNFTTPELIKLLDNINDERLQEEIYSEIAWRVLDYDYKPKLKLVKSENDIDYFEEQPKKLTKSKHNKS